MSAMDIVKSFFPPTPWAYSWQLGIFQWFPATTTLQWLVNYHPAGKFSMQNSRLNLNGRFAWCLMELVGPVQLLYILYKLPAQMSIAELPFWNKAAGALYVIHYFNRSIVNPLFVAPSISPARLEIFLFACIFNWFNSACIGGWIVGYDVGFAGYKPNATLLNDLSPSPLRQMIPYFGTALFLYSMINNIRAERTLWRLRREEALRRAAKKNDGANKETTSAAEKQTNIYHKVYVIPPPNGLFKWILYPHYSFEWLEWIGFVLVGFAVYPVRSGAASLLTQTPSITLAPWLWPFASLANWLKLPLPLPALVFVLNDIFTMLPQARRGRKWYIEKFGKDKVASRTAVIPGIPFL